MCSQTFSTQTGVTVTTVNSGCHFTIPS